MTITACLSKTLLIQTSMSAGLPRQSTRFCRWFFCSAWRRASHSVPWCSSWTTHDSATDVVSRADRSLYEAKAEGKGILRSVVRPSKSRLFENGPRVAAIHTLSAVGTEAAVSALAGALGRQTSLGVTFTARALVKLAARSAIPALANCLHERKDELDGGAKLSIIAAFTAMP